MPSIPVDVLSALHSNQKNVRNICILAHVDHGKTTLADSLISSNGIISAKLAGKIRYLDSRPDEQERGITMKSSCISLLYQDKRALSASGGETGVRVRDKTYLVNLIDSPGHVDFSSEVSTAVRLCDGAFVVVDVVEGVCIQTTGVLRQAWMDKVKPVLVINKVDRLVTELHLTPLEAYAHIKKVLEQVNAVTGALFSSEQLVLQEKLSEQQLAGEDAVGWTEEELDSQEAEVYFSPERGNVIFTSAIDGWGFRIDQFAELYAQKLNIKKELLQRTLWGDFYFSPKQKKIFRRNPTGKLSPMFVQFVLDNIWAVYAAAISDRSKMDKIVKSLQLTIPERDLKQEDARPVTYAVMSRWLPIAEGLLQLCVEQLPSPLEAQPARLSKLWQPSVGASPELQEEQRRLEAAMLACDAASPEVVVFISKVFPVGRDALPAPRRPPAPRGSAPAAVAPSAPSKEKFVAMGRIFSGTLRKGQRVHVLGPRFSPVHPDKFHHSVDVNELFLLMGRGLDEIDQVPAGNIFGIGGIEELIAKTATLSTTPACSVFNTMAISAPIVRVAVEAENPLEMSVLVQGLKTLYQADPSVETFVQESGEHVIVAAGELHLERCLRDLRETYAPIKIRVSPPLVSFRETVVDTAEVRTKLKNSRAKAVQVQTANKALTLVVSAVPLPEDLRNFIQSTAPLLTLLSGERSQSVTADAVESLSRGLISEFQQAKGKWAAEVGNVWELGPRRTGANLLLNHVAALASAPGYEPLLDRLARVAADTAAENFDEALASAAQSVSQLELESAISPAGETVTTHASPPAADIAAAAAAPTVVAGAVDDVIESPRGASQLRRPEERAALLGDLSNSFVNGFQLATASGPLCEEPMMGVCFILHDVIESDLAPNDERLGRLSGQVISAMKEACRQAFLALPARLMEAVYLCDVQVSQEFLGRVYTVLGRRRAKVLSETVKEGISVYAIEALLPVVESFGFAEELLKFTSGAASSQMVFHSWQLLNEDPFFVATTEEDLEDIGANIGGIAPNQAKSYMNAIRKRKGLKVEEKLVEHSEKQRTLKRNK